MNNKPVVLNVGDYVGTDVGEGTIKFIGREYLMIVDDHGTELCVRRSLSSFWLPAEINWEEQMTVQQMIEKLQELPKDKTFLISFDDDYYRRISVEETTMSKYADGHYNAKNNSVVVWDNALRDYKTVVPEKIEECVVLVVRGH